MTLTMQLRNTVCLIALAAAVAGCVTPPTPRPFSALPWQDSRFAYDPSRVTLTGHDVFQLDSELATLLADPQLRRLAPLPRARRLMSLIFGPNRDRFTYEAGTTTVAAETWRRRRGDCISLTVLAYAAARELQLTVELQEVQVPALHVRRQGYEFVNHHVNLRVRIPAQPNGEGTQQLVIDFDPEVAPWAQGKALTERSIVARMYSNLGAEALVQNDDKLAYAYLRAAIINDPAHAASYTNLALLYRRAGLHAQAEGWLRQGIDLGDRPQTAMRAMLELLQEQNRLAEWETLSKQLRRHEESDPHYWIARGSRNLAEGRPADAVRALERAQAISGGFSEVHRQLAIAYWQLERREQVREQLALLDGIEHGHPLVSKLRNLMLTTP